MRRRFFLLLLAATLGGCSHETNGDITAVSVAGRACPSCLDGILMQRDGRIAELKPRALATTDAQVTKAAIDDLPVDQLHTSHFAPVVADANAVAVAVAYADGHVDRVFVPAGDAVVDEIGRLRRWARAFAVDGTDALLATRQAALRNALDDPELTSITIEKRGCAGDCPTTTTTFTVHGAATIRERNAHCEIHANALIPFRSVVQAASPSEARNLRAVLKTAGTDTLGVRLTFVTPNRVTALEGPNDASWGPDFLATENRLDQIVGAATWTPPLDLQTCTGAGTIRL